ncbi:hypothetical protein ABIF52_000448 [Bradyrhizobium japonicum]
MIEAPGSRMSYADQSPRTLRAGLKIAFEQGCARPGRFRDCIGGDCRAHNVPYPGSGYWTRKSLGQTVTLDPLPPEPGEQAVEIQPSKPRVRRTERRTADATSLAPNSAEPANSVAIVVKEQLTKPHPIIASWIVDRERRRREAAASRDQWRIGMHLLHCPRSTAVAMRFLTRCFAPLKARAQRLPKPRKAFSV